MLGLSTILSRLGQVISTARVGRRLSRWWRHHGCRLIRSRGCWPVDGFVHSNLPQPSLTADWCACIYNIYKVPLREEARGVAQERNEEHPAWNEYHYAGNRRIKIVFGYLVRTNTLIIKRTLHFRTGRYLFFAYTWRQTLWSCVILGILCNIIS